MNKIKMYVATHKLFDMDLPDFYNPILVGSFNKDITDYIRDDSKDNISDKNSNYCELTGLYWIWKNDNSDIVGLSHYRRYFKGKDLGLLSKDEIKNILKDNDIVLPKPWYYLKDVYNDYCENHYKKDIDNCEAVLKEFYPEYLDAYKTVMKRKYIYLYNMFVCNKKLLNDYCSWLFDVLSKVEDISNIEDYDNYQKRIYGFLSERLFNVWIEKNNLKIKEVQVYKLGDTKIKVLTGRIKSYIKKTLMKKHN